MGAHRTRRAGERRWSPGLATPITADLAGSTHRIGVDHFQHILFCSRGLATDDTWSPAASARCDQAAGIDFDSDEWVLGNGRPGGAYCRMGVNEGLGRR